MNFPVLRPRDFEPVEAHIAAALACEPGRCAFLRSEGFLRFRMHAVYRAASGDLSVCSPDGLVLQFASAGGGAGGVVTVRKFDMLDTFDDTWWQTCEDLGPA
jgi:hypothetical protein